MFDDLYEYIDKRPMKIQKHFTSLSIAFFISTLPLAAITDAQKNEYFEAYGWVRGKQSGINELKPTPEELELFYKGLKAGINGENPPLANIQEIQPKMNEYFRKRAGLSEEPEQTAAPKDTTATSADNKKNGKEFLDKLLKDNTNVKATASGLHYEITKEGSDTKPQATDRVKVHYEGKLINGEIFDSSLKRGNPATFGLNQVIAGWTEGLQLVGKGGKIRLYIPSELAYGDRDTPSIPAGSTLIFDVELLDIVGK